MTDSAKKIAEEFWKNFQIPKTTPPRSTYWQYALPNQDRGKVALQEQIEYLKQEKAKIKQTYQEQHHLWYQQNARTYTYYKSEFRKREQESRRKASILLSKSRIPRNIYPDRLYKTAKQIFLQENGTFLLQYKTFFDGEPKLPQKYTYIKHKIHTLKQNI